MHTKCTWYKYMQIHVQMCMYMHTRYMYMYMYMYMYSTCTCRNVEEHFTYITCTFLTNNDINFVCSLKSIYM